MRMYAMIMGNEMERNKVNKNLYADTRLNIVLIENEIPFKFIAPYDLDKCYQLSWTNGPLRDLQIVFCKQKTFHLPPTTSN